MNKCVVINADVGEGFGRYSICNDEEMMKYISSANLACGFHAGDPSVMHNTVRLAKKYNVSVGAHPGFQDLRGFGRRMIEISLQDLYDDVVYQIGALDAFLKINDMKMTHINPHGKLDPLVSENEEYANVFVEAIKNYNSELILVIEEKSLLAKIAQAKNLKVAFVAYPDLKYDSDGNMIIERIKSAANPVDVARQTISIIQEGKLHTVEGNEVGINAGVLCYHGDSPNAIEVLREVHNALNREGIKIIKL